MNEKKRALVCLSGGLDSTVSLHWCLKNYDEVLAVFFDYDQKALKSERKASKGLCSDFKLECYEVLLGFVSQFSNSSLNRKDREMPEGVDLESKKETFDAAQSVWVPNRNGLFINAAACLLESKGGGDLILGFNKEEAETFPDNSKEFLEAINESLRFSTQNKVRLFSPTVLMSKVEIFKLGLELGFDQNKVWPCYKSGDRPCGVCESCLRFYRAKVKIEKEKKRDL